MEKSVKSAPWHRAGGKPQGRNPIIMQTWPYGLGGLPGTAKNIET